METQGTNREETATISALLDGIGRWATNLSDDLRSRPEGEFALLLRDAAHELADNLSETWEVMAQEIEKACETFTDDIAAEPAKTQEQATERGGSFSRLIAAFHFPVPGFDPNKSFIANVYGNPGTAAANGKYPEVVTEDVKTGQAVNLTEVASVSEQIIEKKDQDAHGHRKPTSPFHLTSLLTRNGINTRLGEGYELLVSDEYGLQYTVMIDDECNQLLMRKRIYFKVGTTAEQRQSLAEHLTAMTHGIVSFSVTGETILVANNMQPTHTSMKETSLVREVVAFVRCTSSALENERARALLK